MEAASTPCFVDAGIHKASGLVQFETSEILKGVLKVRILGLFERPREVVAALQSPARTGKFALVNGRLVQESVVWSKRPDLRKTAHFVCGTDVASVEPCEIPAACRTPHRFALIAKRPTPRPSGNFATAVAGLRASLDLWSITVLGCYVERPAGGVPLYEWLDFYDIRPPPKKVQVEKWHFELVLEDVTEEVTREESKLETFKRRLRKTTNDLEHLRSMPILTGCRPKKADHLLHKPSNVAKLKASASADDLLPVLRRDTFLIVR